ncbi:MAG TPA: GTPase domain-containing protein [Acidobacteriota bacterium]
MTSHSNDLRELIRALTGVLPAGARRRVEWVLADVNQDRGWPGIWRRLEREGSIWRSDPVRVVFVGPSGSGKRTLIRHLFGSQALDDGIFSVVETPGIDEYLGYGRDAGLLRSAASAELIISVLDAGLKPTHSTLSAIQSIEELGVPCIIVLAKLDQASDPDNLQAEYRKILGRNVSGVSYRKPDTLRGLLREIVLVQPRVLFALARRYPEYRAILTQQVLEESSVIAAALALIPQPLDTRVLAALVQAVLFLKIRRIYAKPFDWSAALQMVGAVGGVVAVESALDFLLPKAGLRKKAAHILAAAFGIFLVGKALQRHCRSQEDNSPVPKEAA